MSEYLLINIAIIFFPIILSFEKKLNFFKKIPSVIFSVIIVSSIYIIWDTIATSSGDWGFNPKYLNGIAFYNLPIEEILFFITVPYSCIFIYETIRHYVTNKELSFKKKHYYLLSLLLFVLAIVFHYQNYTFTVLIFCAAFLSFATFYFFDFLNTNTFWFTILVSYVPFMIVNYILTALPIVIYSNNAIWGLRIITIPLEDFFYSFSMIAFWILTYHLAQIFASLIIKSKQDKPISYYGSP